MKFHTAPTIRTALALVQTGIGVPAVARRLQLKRNTVYSWTRRYGTGVPRDPRQHAPEVRERALHMIEDGESIAETARTLRISFSTVQEWAARAGVKSRYTFPDPRRYKTTRQTQAAPLYCSA